MNASCQKDHRCSPQGLDNIFSILWLIFGIWYHERDVFRQSWCSQNWKLVQGVAFSLLHCLSWKLRQFSLSVGPVSIKTLLNWSPIPDYAVIFQAIQTGKNTFLLLHYKAAQATSNRFLLLPVLPDYQNWSAEEKILANLQNIHWAVSVQLLTSWLYRYKKRQFSFPMVCFQATVL